MGRIGKAWPALLVALGMMACVDEPGGLQPVSDPPIFTGPNFNPMPDSAVYLFQEASYGIPGAICTSMVVRTPIGRAQDSAGRSVARFRDSTVSQCEVTGQGSYTRTTLDSVAFWESGDKLYEEIRPVDTARSKKVYEWPQKRFPAARDVPFTQVKDCTYREDTLEVPCRKLSESDRHSSSYSISLAGKGILERGSSSNNLVITSTKWTLLAMVKGGDTTWYRGEVVLKP